VLGGPAPVRPAHQPGEHPGLLLLQPDELGAALDVDQPVDALVDESLTHLKSLAPKALAPKALDPKGVTQP
jgi:hypothetical protein